MSQSDKEKEGKKNKGGRPPKFKSVEELERMIEQYFSKCDEDKKPYTISGLAIALGTVRQTLLNYEEKDGFLDTIKKAKSRCEEYAESRLFTSQQCTGAIFTLKNNYGWSDAKEIKGEHDIKVVIIDRFGSSGKPEKDSAPA